MRRFRQKTQVDHDEDGQPSDETYIAETLSGMAETPSDEAAIWELAQDSPSNEDDAA